MHSGMSICFHFRLHTTIPATMFRDRQWHKMPKVWEDTGANKKCAKQKKRDLCVLNVFHFHGTKASSGNTVLQLALDVIVPAEKALSFLRGCIQIYSLTAATDHSRDVALWQWKIFFTLQLAGGGFSRHGFPRLIRNQKIGCFIKWIIMWQQNIYTSVNLKLS